MVGHPESPPTSRKQARAVGLVYVTDVEPGIRRRRHGKAFIYQDSAGRRVTDDKQLQRIRSLAIPPAYNEVWICSDASGHLQATGRDVRGRKQYRYHPRWRSLRDNGKFDRVERFGAQLQNLRRRIRGDLAKPGLPHEKVLALIVRLLDETLIRIGNERYTRDNRSYGLTTLRSKHVLALHGRLRFEFRGKSGQQREAELSNRRLARIVRRMQQLPGERLFQYLDEDGQRQPIDSGQVNDYLHLVCGDEFSAKDFRTWGGTVQAAAVLARTPLPEGDRAQRIALTLAIKQVAAFLGNTPAVCRGSYIHPLIIDGWLTGSLHRAISADTAVRPRQLEQRVMRFLRRRRSAP
jgi:DNA topoisomerase IB